MSLWIKNQKTLTKTDHCHLINIARGASRVVEFGPGYSTLAFIEAGVNEIIGLEHDSKWNEVQVDRFKDYPQVTIDWYYNEAPKARVPDFYKGVDFDFAFVDSPKGYAAARVLHPGQEDCSRLNTCLAALDLTSVVYLHDAQRPLERATLSRLEVAGHRVEFVSYPEIGAKKLDDTYGIARITRNGKEQDGPHLSGVAKPWGTSDGTRPE